VDPHLLHAGRTQEAGPSGPRARRSIQLTDTGSARGPGRNVPTEGRHDESRGTDTEPSLRGAGTPSKAVVQPAVMDRGARACGRIPGPGRPGRCKEAARRHDRVDDAEPLRLESVEPGLDDERLHDGALKQQRVTSRWLSHGVYAFA
jgi:hypothetical protein